MTEYDYGAIAGAIILLLLSNKSKPAWLDTMMILTIFALAIGIGIRLAHVL